MPDFSPAPDSAPHSAPRAVLADDEPLLLAELRDQLAEAWPALHIVAEAGNGPAAFDAIVRQRPDVAFLDIRMPGLTGLEVAQRIATELPADARPRIVFVTAYDDHAIEAFEQAALDYLLKPLTPARLAVSVARLREALAQRDASRAQGISAAPDALAAALARLLPQTAAPAPLRWVKAAQGGTVRMIPLDEVCYFSATDKYTAVFTRDGEALLRTPLKTLLERLDPARFTQIHRATIVNLDQIVDARPECSGNWTVGLRHRPERLTVSRSYAHLFRAE